jgi:hypothetical protein
MTVTETSRTKEDYRGFLYLAVEVFKGIRAGTSFLTLATGAKSASI